ncbi:hypothetical protein SDC9_207082 [bioreactor metagenome]|uniref:tRNA threonylcarbamoyladenosine biosynthesis protein TsaE n=1 Tax=bioreactor metagenome TaxID=1076179 RepID=A0A645J6W6_9ZZZZ
MNHFDVYRIKGEDDLESCGFFDLISDGITLCEWSDNIPFALPSERYDVKISKDGSTDNIRHITIEKTGDRL